jgi:protein translocase SecG subunit
MQMLIKFLPYIQTVLAILLVISVLLQTRGSSVGGAFGGDTADTSFYTRRGAELTLFKATIVLAVLFVVSVFASLFVA